MAEHAVVTHAIALVTAHDVHGDTGTALCIQQGSFLLLMLHRDPQGYATTTTKRQGWEAAESRGHVSGPIDQQALGVITRVSCVICIECTPCTAETRAKGRQRKTACKEGGRRKWREGRSNVFPRCLDALTGWQ